MTIPELSRHLGVVDADAVLAERLDELLATGLVEHR